MAGDFLLGTNTMGGAAKNRLRFGVRSNTVESIWRGMDLVSLCRLG